MNTLIETNKKRQGEGESGEGGGGKMREGKYERKNWERRKEGKKGTENLKKHSTEMWLYTNILISILSDCLCFAGICYD